MNTKISSWFYQFSFFEFIGLLSFGTIISNYFLDKTLINIGVFLTYCLIGFCLSIIKFYLNYKKFTYEERN